MTKFLDTVKKQKEVPYGTHIKAVLPAKYKTTYQKGIAFQTDDLYGETRLVREEKELFGVVHFRPLIKHGQEHPTKKVRGLLTDDTNTFYPFNKLKNIQIIVTEENNSYK